MEDNIFAAEPFDQAAPLTESEEAARNRLRRYRNSVAYKFETDPGSEFSQTKTGYLAEREWGEPMDFAPEKGGWDAATADFYDLWSDRDIIGPWMDEKGLPGVRYGQEFLLPKATIDKMKLVSQLPDAEAKLLLYSNGQIDIATLIAGMSPEQQMEILERVGSTTGANTAPIAADNAFSP